jgi:hypothetical protein
VLGEGVVVVGMMNRGAKQHETRGFADGWSWKPGRRTRHGWLRKICKGRWIRWMGRTWSKISWLVGRKEGGVQHSPNTTRSHRMTFGGHPVTSVAQSPLPHGKKELRTCCRDPTHGHDSFSTARPLWDRLPRWQVKKERKSSPSHNATPSPTPPRANLPPHVGPSPDSV